MTSARKGTTGIIGTEEIVGVGTERMTRGTETEHIVEKGNTGTRGVERDCLKTIETRTGIDTGNLGTRMTRMKITVTAAGRGDRRPETGGQTNAGGETREITGHSVGGRRDVVLS